MTNGIYRIIVDSPSKAETPLSYDRLEDAQYACASLNTACGQVCHFSYEIGGPLWLRELLEEMKEIGRRKRLSVNCRRELRPENFLEGDQ